jgi:hypothetical protein
MTKTYGNGESCAACDSSFAGCRSKLTLLMGILPLMSFVLSAYGQAQPNGNSQTQQQAPKRHFVCNVGYTPIRHEFAHALCNDRDETRAERGAIALKNGMPLSCRVSEQVSAANLR